jgi:hypothetical protein
MILFLSTEARALGGSAKGWAKLATSHLTNGAGLS